MIGGDILNINLNGELYEFIYANGEKRGDVYIIEYDSGDTFVARLKDKKTFFTIKQDRISGLKPYIVDDALYRYIIRNCTIYNGNCIWDLFLNAYYKGEQVYLTACNGVVYITSS